MVSVKIVISEGSACSASAMISGILIGLRGMFHPTRNRQRRPERRGTSQLNATKTFGDFSFQSK